MKVLGPHIYLFPADIKREKPLETPHDQSAIRLKLEAVPIKGKLRLVAPRAAPQYPKIFVPQDNLPDSYLGGRHKDKISSIG